MKVLKMLKIALLSVICAVMFITLMFMAIYQQQYKSEMQLARYSQND